MRSLYSLLAGEIAFWIYESLRRRHPVCDKCIINPLWVKQLMDYACNIKSQTQKQLKALYSKGKLYCALISEQDKLDAPDKKLLTHIHEEAHTKALFDTSFQKGTKSEDFGKQININQIVPLRLRTTQFQKHKAVMIA